jgi:hypothetical protein
MSNFKEIDKILCAFICFGSVYILSWRTDDVKIIKETLHKYLYSTSYVEGKAFDT